MGRRKRIHTKPTEIDWRDIPVSQRPRNLQFPFGIYFKTWQYLRWYLLLLLPVIFGMVAVWIRREGLFRTVGTFVLGAGVALALFITLCSRIQTSNWGTYFRSTEPVRYWLGVAVAAGFYVLFGVVGGYFIHWR